MPAYLNVNEACEFLRLGQGPGPRERLRNLIRRNGLPVCRRPGCRMKLFRVEDLERWVAGERIGKPAARKHTGV